MSRSRQGRRRPGDDPERGLLVRSYAVTHPPGLDIRPRALAWHQLCHAVDGVMSVESDAGAWIIPPHRAVFIPRGTRHAVAMAGKVSLRTLFFAPGFARTALPAAFLRTCQVVNVPPLLRELVLAATHRGLLWRHVAAEARLARVILDQLETLPEVPLQLPAPRDPRARRAAELLAAPGGAALCTRALARKAGASQRTLERLFARETHLTLGRWRQRQRFVEALKRLGEGQPVTAVALEVGYDSPSAFISAFRRQFGATPRRYFGQHPAGGGARNLPTKASR